MEDTTDSFYHLGLAPKMLELLNRLNFAVPTPVQRKAIPIVLQGQDVVAIAQTGTGKTLAFGLPLIQNMASKVSGRTLVIVPTRELAQQVGEALSPILRVFGIKGAVLIGGASINMQIQNLRRNPRMIIATPGRLQDHLDRRTIRLNDVSAIVLDEADRMLDMGFAPQVDRIIRAASPKRQTLLFSATIPTQIVNLATKYMKLPIQVEIAPSGTVATDVNQELFIIQEDAKRPLLKALLNSCQGTILIFVRTKMKTRRITKGIRDLGHSVAEIHSDRTMPQRKSAMDGFKTGRFRILVATDIAARGIDVSLIELVINYDLPDDIENYIHRIGRTGRAGQKGKAITFATPDQGQEVAQIERFIQKTLPRASHSEFPSYEFTNKSAQGQKPGFGNKRAGRSGQRRHTFGRHRKSNLGKRRF